MTLTDKILDPALPVRLFELVPPAAENPAIENVLAEVSKVRHLTDAVNLPEIRNESRGSPRAARFIPRMEPRVLGARIVRELGTDVVVNRCVVYEADQLGWFEETSDKFGIQNIVLVGGESSRSTYPGPSVIEATREIHAAHPDACLGGITIPSRLHEAERIRQKVAAGLSFFTTQVLFDSNDIVWLVQRLSGLEARIFLSFAPVSHPRDLEFLRWLGADIPSDLDHFLLKSEPTTTSAVAQPATAPATVSSQSYLNRSLNLAQRILMDVFDNLPPDPPPLGLNVEHVNRRNFHAALKMLEQLGGLYSSLVATRARTPLSH